MQIEALAPIAEHLSRSLSLAAVAQELAESLVTQAGAAASRVWVCGPGDRCHACPLVDECRDRSECLHLSGASGCEVGSEGAFARYPIGARTFGQVVGNRAPFVCHQPAADRRLQDGTALAAAAIKCCTAWPLLADSAPIGVLVIYSREEMSDSDLQQISALCRRAADIIANASRADQLRRRLSIMEQYSQLLGCELLSARHHEQILGVSAAMRSLRERIEVLAARQDPVLICGPPGSGKELAARAIHAHCTRRREPFIRIDCRNIREDHLESELFGGGGPPGSPLLGRLELADGGTLFLKHVDQLSEPMQQQLLQVCQTGRALRRGGESAYPVRVRVIASSESPATQRTPFLTFLARSTLSVSPLSARPEDIPVLLEHNLRRFARLHGRTEFFIEPADVASLETYPWPGNVRELIHLAERAVLLASGPVIRFELSLTIPQVDPAPPAPCTRLDEVEREHITRVLRQTHGVIQGSTGAAALLGLRPSTLRSRMVKLQIPRHP